MKAKTLLLITFATLLLAFSHKDAHKKGVSEGNFDIEKDLLLLQCDFKTDVDDLHTVAAFATIIHDSQFSSLNFHVVAGTYGVQEGLYVPPNPLLQLAFGDNWTDAHNDVDAAVQKVKSIAKQTFANGGDIWISEAGQSDFSARLVKALQSDLSDLSVFERIHIVQHSEWNETAASDESLEFVQNTTDYHKIPDGNAVGNGTPGFRNPDFTQWESKVSSPELREIWELAIDISNEYNGKEGRYNNEAVAAGGLDFSDLAAVCWILGIHDEIEDEEDFFNRFSS
ncbi:MAG: hypothetical protein CL666_06280 [Balneola sp.]|nr:hypothetical protein [Balneola sp.]|tara:strand:- start:44260 stop:45108 length:849 start_codon:yes stop_codon:yes gene_type:complete